jgi:2-oxo-3-hexenedioate decarboxylase
MTPQALLSHCDSAAPWPAEHGIAPDLAAGYQSALAVRGLRSARGEQPRGYKVGFTNRTIWPRYGIHAPIWGTVWDTTLQFCEGEGQVDLAGTCNPRIEPEIAFGLAATPPAGATLEQLFACVQWLAPSFEVVQSHCAWKFASAAEPVADGGLHARLLVGRRTPVRRLASSGAALDAQLGAARLQLFEGECLVDEGLGANVLDGPLHALLHFVLELQACPGAPALAAGDVVTTGTWTDAWPIAAGQRWSTRIPAPFDTLAVALR